MFRGKSSDLVVNLASNVQSHDKIAYLVVATFGWTSENWWYAKTVDFRLARLEARVPCLVGQTDHEVLGLPLTRVQYLDQVTLARPQPSKVTGNDVEEPESALRLQEHVSERRSEKRTLVGKVKERPGLESLDIESRRDSTKRLHNVTLAETLAAHMRHSQKLGPIRYQIRPNLIAEMPVGGM